MNSGRGEHPRLIMETGHESTGISKENMSQLQNCSPQAGFICAVQREKA
jgi:hypothetical protein